MTVYQNMETDVCTPQGECASFDAALPDGSYCEVKVYDFDANEWVLENTSMIAGDHVSSIEHRSVATECKINYCYVVADPRHIPIVSSWGTTSDIRLREDCL